MKQVGIHQTKTHLSSLLRKVAKGEEIVIANAGKPVAKIIPFEKPLANRVMGCDVGKGWVSPDFDDPLPDDLLEEFYK